MARHPAPGFSFPGALRRLGSGRPGSGSGILSRLGLVSASIGLRAPANADPQPRPKSPLVAAALSFVFPGAGQLYLGRRRTAAVFAIPSVAVVLWVVVQLDRGLVWFALGMLDQGYAITVLGLAAAFTLWRLLSIAEPFAVGRTRPVTIRAGIGLALLLVGAVGMGDVVVSNAYDAWAASGRIASNDFHVAYATPAPTPVASIAGATSTPMSGPDYQYVAAASFIPEATDTPGPCATEAATPEVRALPARIFADVAPSPSPSTPSPSPSTPSPAPSPAPSPSRVPSPSPSPSASDSPGGSPSPSPSPSAGASPSAGPSASPSPTPIKPWGRSHNSNRLTIVLAGVDMMSGRAHALTDSLMLVSVDLRTRAVTMVSVPRDTAGFPLYWGGDSTPGYKINNFANLVSAGYYGAPDPPMMALANEIGFLVGIPVDYYAEIDMDGFFQMVDLVGGVDIDNPRTLDDPFSCTFVPAGPVHLDAQGALQYVRSRESTSDYDRAARQQRVLVALEHKVASPGMLPALGSILDLASRSISTNFPLGSTRDYLDLAENIGSVSGCVLGPPYNYHPDSSLTGGAWTSQLLLDRVANLSVALFGYNSRYFGQPGATPTYCES